MDSVATSKEKIFAPQILAAQKSLEQAEALHGKLFSQTSQVLMDNATAKLSAMNAKNGALWAILFMFGLGAILIEAVITAIIAFMEVNATCQIERAFAKAVQKSDALDGIGAGYGEQPSGAQTPTGLGKRQGGVRPPSPSGSGRKGSSIPLDIDSSLFN